MLKVRVKVKGHVIRGHFCAGTKIASSRRQMAGLRPNLHTMVSRSACIQDVLKVKVKVKGQVTRAGIFADGSFVINSVQRDDAGWYTCRPTNGLGVPPEASAFLDVTCEFSQPMNISRLVYLVCLFRARIRIDCVKRLWV